MTVRLPHLAVGVHRIVARAGGLSHRLTLRVVR
jgi:hypothetical protein